MKMFMKEKVLKLKKQLCTSVQNNWISLKKQKHLQNLVLILLISSESNVHGISEDSVHFHEASSIDTLVDIVGSNNCFRRSRTICRKNYLFAYFCWWRFCNTFSHGIMSNPASAILEILKNSNLDNQRK